MPAGISSSSPWPPCLATEGEKKDSDRLALVMLAGEGREWRRVESWGWLLVTCDLVSRLTLLSDVITDHLLTLVETIGRPIRTEFATILGHGSWELLNSPLSQLEKQASKRTSQEKNITHCHQYWPVCPSVCMQLYKTWYQVDFWSCCQIFCSTGKKESQIFSDFWLSNFFCFSPPVGLLVYWAF